MQLELASDNIDFKPPLGRVHQEGVMDMIDYIVGTFLQISTLFKRLDSDGTYMKHMHMNIGINSCMSILSEALAENEVKCLELKQQFDTYSYLWTTDLPQYFHDFCEESTISTENGLKLLDTEKFDVAIIKCTEVQNAVTKFKSPIDIGWLRIDTTPAKQQISFHASKWITIFTKHILDKVTLSMTEIHEFMENVLNGIDCEVDDKPENKEILMGVMSIIRDVRKKMDSVHLIFDHQRKCIQMLRRHGIEW